MGDAVAGALSPDGTVFAYIGERVGPRTVVRTRQHILLERLDEGEVRPLEGTVGARSVSFSPDSKWVVYQTTAAESTHKAVYWKKSLAGGPSVKLLEVSSQGAFRASWSDSGFLLVIADFLKSIRRVNEDGSGARIAAKADEANDSRFTSIEALPGGRAALATVESGAGSSFRSSVALINLEDGSVKTLLDDGGQPRYVPRPTGGLLVFTRAEAVLAAPFNLERLELSPGVSPVLSGVRTDIGMPGAAYGFGGSLLWYEPGGDLTQRRLVKMDRSGAKTPLTDAVGLFHSSSNLSPDGKHVACGAISQSKALEIAVIDIPQGTVHRVGQNGADVEAPAWSPDGERLYFAASSPAQPPRIMSCRADLSDDPTPLISAEPGVTILGPIAFNKDGSVLTCFRFSAETSTDVVAVNLSDKRIIPLVATKARERNGRISPDGKLLVYDADPTGQLEVYLAPLTPGAGAGHGIQISTAGGASALWSPKGDEVFYLSQAGLMSVKLTGLSASTPTVLVGPEIMDHLDGGDVTPDGDHFIFIEKGESEKPRTHVTIVQNWMSALPRSDAPH
jgi:Tol biopolymer transport system component